MYSILSKNHGFFLRKEEDCGSGLGSEEHFDVNYTGIEVGPVLKSLPTKKPYSQ